MEVTFAPNQHLQVDDARIVFRNFAGTGTEFNREGDRNFSLVIEDQELSDALIARGWNVKIRPPRDEDSDPFIHMPVKVKMGGSTVVKLVRPGLKPLELDEESIKCLDHMDIERIDMDIRPYDWVINEGKPSEKRGRSAYLQTMYVTQSVNRFAERYEHPMDDEPPFDVDEY
jgi:hypothetical protein